MITGYLKQLNKATGKKYYVVLEEDWKGSLHYKVSNVTIFKFDSEISFFRQIKEMISEFSVKKIKLNSEYTAEILKDGVKVGCQTIPWSKVMEIANYNPSRVGQSSALDNIEVGSYFTANSVDPHNCIWFKKGDDEFEVVKSGVMNHKGLAVTRKWMDVQYRTLSPTCFLIVEKP